MLQIYRREFEFMRSFFRRLRIPVRLVRSGSIFEGLDNELWKTLGVETNYEYAYRMMTHRMDEKTIYRVFDQFLRHYIYFNLQEDASSTIVVLGPYLTTDPTQETIMELVESMGMSLTVLPQLNDYYASLPVFPDTTAIMNVVLTFGEVLWGVSELNVVDMNYDQDDEGVEPVFSIEAIEQEDILLRMKQMETRYAHENKLLEFVSKGMISQVETLMANVSRLNYQRRQADPLRNMKNYCIICNTLLRKAAETGGVHPLYLDRTSEQFARAIEIAPTADKCSDLIREMLRSYCLLVRTHAEHHYSPLVQKTLTYIDANLSSDLSLSALAHLLQVSPAYLSTLFHRDTGRTVTEHITDSRMKTASQLLKNTRLQVQSIAQRCGFSDPNYFGKQFKRYYGITPLQYRKTQFRSDTDEV